jgi:glycosyltransferase involved in cell wall biosynthesis
VHYLGYDSDRGGIASIVRTLSETGRFACILGVNTGFRQTREPRLPTLEFPRLNGERIGIRNALKARLVAGEVKKWLQASPTRVFHGHSRAGLLVALWLLRGGERRVVVSVHCYGRHRWFYRWCSRHLGERLFWLSPAMKVYYGVDQVDPWFQCIPGCVPPDVGGIGISKVDPNVVRFGGIGAIERWKNWDIVLRAIAGLPKETRNLVRFTHIGSIGGSSDSRNYAAELQEQTDRLGLRSVVEWRGEQPSAQGLLHEIDCLLIASRNEPFSAAMLEALAARVPVLAADSGGAQDILDPAQSGWLFISDDTSDLIRKIGFLVNTDALRRIRINMSDNQRFPASVVAEQWARVYGHLTRAK